MLSFGAMTKPVELRVGGSTYRVVSSADAEELERLAGVVDEKLSTLIPPGRPIPPQAVLLAAIALARDLELERERSARLVARSRATVSEMLCRLDGTLAHAEAKLQRSDGPR